MSTRMIPPGCTCATCHQPMPGLARRTDEGWVCAGRRCIDCCAPVTHRATKGRCRDCDIAHRRAAPKPPPKPCTDCGEPISRRSSSGLCRRCYDRFKKRRNRELGRLKPKHKYIGQRTSCTRCGASTTRADHICRDCADVLGEEIGRWVA